MLRKSPGFTLIAVLTLALGIGATTAMFSVVNGVLLKPLPYPQPERLIDVDYTFALPGGAVEDTNLSPAHYLVFRQYNRTFQDVGIYDFGINASGDLVNITHSGQPERAPAVRVSDGVLQALGVRPLLGRLFMSTDDQPGSPDMAILTYGYWRSKFGGDRSIVGKTIEVDNQPRIIIGVLPKWFVFLDKPTLAVLLPITIEHEGISLFYDDYGGIARLKPGVTLAQANADAERMIAIKLQTFPFPGYVANLEQRLRPNLSPLKKKMIGEADKVLWVLMGGIGLVLLIACANVANLLLVRLEGRRQELAIRAALGASRGRITTELLSESLVLAVLGGVFGLGIAYGALRVLVAVAPPGLPRLSEIVVDGKVVVFALVVSVATTLVFGSIPAFKYARTSLGIRLHEGERSMSESRERRRARSLLVVVQVALAVVLLVSAGLMIRTFRALTNVNPGFAAPSEVQTFRAYIPEAQVHDPERVAHIEQEISDKIHAIPGISAVGISRDLPMDGNEWGTGCGPKGRTYSPSEPPPRCRRGFFGPGFLKTLGIPLLAGRDFTWGDAYNELPVVIVSEDLAREFWHDPAKAVGEQITSGGPNNWREIVGIVGDVHQDGVDKQPPPTLYLPMLVDQIDGLSSEGVQRDTAFAMRSPRAGSESLMNQVREAVRSVDPDLPLSEVHTLAYYYTRSMARTSFLLVMLSLAGGMALLLGAIGLYGVIAYSVSQRTHEIGIRLALGAQRDVILGLIMRQGIKLTLLGIAIGVPASLGLTRFLRGLLFGINSTDPVTFVGVFILVELVALLACFVPVRRAVKVDPIVALRYE
ncbi:MAG TPA: ABC transporter permease [Candidatus Acidoferrales bacterium]|nr:ABC transporter permease [Candidatus Acidoferrales bacterium]